MKTKLFILLVALTALMSSCESGSKPTKEELQNYLSILSAYYPYSADEVFVFVNDSLNRTWTAKADDRREGVYPYKNIYIRDTYGRSSYHNWNITIEANMAVDGIDPDKMPPIGQCTDFHDKYGLGKQLIWHLSLVLGSDEYYRTSMTFQDFQEDIYAYFTDTIILSFPKKSSQYPSKSTPEGVYARIIKHQGLTDFSTDGKTVWRRVKQ